MKKVFIIHGLNGQPNGGWRPWLMGELAHRDIYACALAMPTPDAPVAAQWIAEIARQCVSSSSDDIYLVGHSLGATAIVRYLEHPATKPIAGAVLVSGPAKHLPDAGKKHIDTFVDHDFDFEAARKNCPRFCVIHGDDDTVVPPDHATFLARQLDAQLIWIKNGAHLNGSAGWLKLPPLLHALQEMF